MGETQDAIPEQALAWHLAGTPAALATVIQTWGSAPRPVGAQLAIAGAAEMAGSVSGGCVEGAVVAEALDALEDGRPRLLEFGVSDDEAFAVGLACGGTIRVLVEPVGVGQGPDEAALAALTELREKRVPAVLATHLETFERRLLSVPGDPLWPQAAARIASGKSGIDGDWFFGVHNPPLKLVIVGAVHIAQPLVAMARLAGYDPVIVDPRDAFASEARFPSERIVRDWPDAALAAEGLDIGTAVVTLTHDPKLDDPAIITALRSDVFYLGCLGSTRTHAKRQARLAEAGFSAQDMARIHAPVGLDIGAAAPAEIAVSILAEMTERLRRPASRPTTAAA